MFFDTHAHVAPWSHDASLTIDELLQETAQKKLIGICTADHYEKDLFYERGYEDIYDPEALFEQLYPLRKVPSLDREGPAFLVGTEIGWLPHLNHHLADLVSHYPFDSVILSLHVFDGHDPFLESDFYDAGLDVVYRTAIERMSDMILACPNFDLIGHFDYISRYTSIPACKMQYTHAPEAFDRLFSLLRDRNKGLEINTGTFAALERAGYRDDARFPDPAIIRRYLELGGTILALGSDAHRPGQIAQNFDQIRPWLIELGVDKLTYFVERKPIPYSII